MPFGDGTGPLGLGPMTGRGLGYCAGFNVPGCFQGFGRGFGFGRGRGFGRGFRFRFWQRAIPFFAQRPFVQTQPISQAELKKAELQMLEEELKAIKERIDQLRKELKETKK